MTRGPKTDIVVLALLLSLAAHVGAMLYARPRVMTRVAAGISRTLRRGPMHLTRERPQPEPTDLETVPDVAAVAEAPKADETVTSVPTAEPTLPDLAPAVATPVPPAPTGSAPVPVETPVEVMVSERAPAVPKPAETVPSPLSAVSAPLPLAAPAASAAPVDTPVVAAVGNLPTFSASPVAAPSTVRPEAGEAEKREGESEKPVVEEILAEVDEKVISREKEAVRSLVDVPDAQELAPWVQMVMQRETTPDGIYFRVMISPRAKLRTVPKDIVLLLDASGSIGVERLGSVRAAAKKVLRSAANSEDRFNLVAFRDRYSYAFATWQACTTAAYAAADRWLDAVAPHGRTDVFGTISSVLTLPRNPRRPLIALVVTDGEANAGVSDNAEIIRRFTALNDGLVSVYMYGVKSSANRELIDLLTRNNRGESHIFDGFFRSNAGKDIGSFSERFRDPVLSDLRLVFAAGCRVESYPRLLGNLYRGGTLELVGRAPAAAREIAFSLKGLNGSRAFESFFRLSLASAPVAAGLSEIWRRERDVAVR